MHVPKSLILRTAATCVAPHRHAVPAHHHLTVCARHEMQGSRLIIAIQILLWVSAVISGVLDNIPYTIGEAGYHGLCVPTWCDQCPIA